MDHEFDLSSRENGRPRHWIRTFAGLPLAAFGALLVYAFCWGMVDLTKETAPRGLAYVFAHLTLDIFGLLGLICLISGVSWILNLHPSRVQRIRSVFVAKLLFVGGAVSLVVFWVLLFYRQE